MKIIYQSDKEKVTTCAATVGFFDGVHAGHRFLIEELKSIALKRKLKSVVVTFAVHPRKVLNSEFQPQLLTTLSEKLQQLESTGIDTCIVLDFDKEMAGLSAYEFLKTILYKNYNVHTLLVGHDHRFGHNRTDGFQEYYQYGREIGIDVIQAKRFSTETDTHISSSEIRDSLQNGKIELANRILSYNYSIRGKVIDGFKIGRKLGFPTANLELENKDKLLPALGVYAVRVHYNNLTYKGMMNIGHRPTIENGSKISLEVFILDFDKEIYYETIVIEFISKIRDEKKFNNINELIEQLNKDRLSVMNIDNQIVNE